MPFNPPIPIDLALPLHSAFLDRELLSQYVVTADPQGPSVAQG
ncbi:hypothetical protein ACFRIC_07205 [Streptomyces sp. NPDC056738]